MQRSLIIDKYTVFELDTITESPLEDHRCYRDERPINILLPLLLSNFMESHVSVPAFASTFLRCDHAGRKRASHDLIPPHSLRTFCSITYHL